MEKQFETPILFTTFNRPEETRRVFVEIKKLKPKFLFISADGPRNEAEKEKTNETRSIIKDIDWDCELKTKFEENNLGCKMAMSSAITWFFTNVEKGIILEDDCLPHPDFFRFCEELLEKYKDNPQIMMISGDNFQDGIKRGDGSYYFSKFCHIWGWASWRSAWQHFDLAMHGFEDFKKNREIEKITTNKRATEHFLGAFEMVHNNTLDTWDYQWLYAIWKNDGLGVLPNVNLVSNIGHNELATHTKTRSIKGDRKTYPLGNIVHPSKIERNKLAYDYTFRLFFNETLSAKIRRYMRKLWL